MASSAGHESPSHLQAGENRLESLRIEDRELARRTLDRLASRVSEECMELLRPGIVAALSQVADPDRALVTLERFAERHPDAGSLLEQLARRPRALETLVTLFAGSQFLTDFLLQSPEDLPDLLESWRLAQTSSPEAVEEEMHRTLSGLGEDPASAWQTLRRLQRRELLRVGAGDLMGLLDLPTVIERLSRLAEAVVREGLLLSRQRLPTPPPLEDFSVLAFGKLGGRELNYSSDIDLVFVARQGAERYRRLAQRLVEGLGRPPGGGFLYRVDLRLRPWGRDGPLVTTVDAYLEYLRKAAKPAERQALLKARAIAGSISAGEELLEEARLLALDAGQDELRKQVMELKESIERDLRRRGRERDHVKSGPGSIRDVEFATQYLQLRDGARAPDLLTPNTLEALSRLLLAGRLAEREYRTLVEGYVFMRTVEHYLQLMHYRQEHELPRDRRALESLARRLRFRGADAADRFRQRFEQHRAAIRGVYDQLLSAGGEPGPKALEKLPPSTLAGMPTSYTEAFTTEERRAHLDLASDLSADRLVKVEAEALDDGGYQVTIVGYEFLGELGIICGLLFVHGFNIQDGRIFTTHHRHRPRDPTGGELEGRELIVDVFTVRSQLEKPSDGVWRRFAEDLLHLLQRLEAGERQEAQVELAKRIALALPHSSAERQGLLPIDITFDNERDPEHTVIRIEAPDTLGFLYELTSALALHGISVKGMTVGTAGSRVADTLRVTDSRGGKIEDDKRLRELRMAVVLTKHFTHLLPGSPNPESALLHFREFLGDLFRRPDWSASLASLERPEVLQRLARLLGISDFLWDDFLRMQHASLFPVLGDVQALRQAKDRRQMSDELYAAVEGSDGAEHRRILNAFKDREMFRIDMRQILGFTGSFEEFSSELTALGEVVFEVALELAQLEIEKRYGRPPEGAELSVCGLGKFGGKELGFASDFEVLFVYSGQGESVGGERSVPLSELYQRLVETVCSSIQARQEGIFELDLRLRPYGSAGPLAVSLESFCEYFGAAGDAWWYERQALIKLRPVAGSGSLGERIVAQRDEILFWSASPDLAAHRAMRERQLRHQVVPGSVNAKYSRGGLVDLEYLVQLQQLVFGGRHPELRTTNTLQAIATLSRLGLLQQTDAETLEAAYRFLRRLIDALRIVRGNARDLTVPPVDEEAFSFLARRLGVEDEDRLAGDLEHHLGRVRECSDRVLRRIDQRGA